MGAQSVASIAKALNINKNSTKLWTRRKIFLIFISHFLSSHPPSAGFLFLNIMKVVEMEEMKREISFFCDNIS